ncbi:MAG TPA: histidine kinase [Chitinophagaceae bacterium]
MNKKNWQLDHPLLRVLQHLFFWVLSFILFLAIFKTGPKPATVDYIYTALFQASLFPAVYLNLEFLLPKFGTRKGFLLYALALSLIIILFTWLNYNFFAKWSATIFPDYFFISYFTFKEIAVFFIIYIVITTLLKLSKSWFFVSELQKKLLEKEKQKTALELKALKAQINPHFFFNTLNSIYSMALDKDDRLPGSILQLSDLMRYFLYASKDHFVPLENELAVAENYIALQKIRSGKQLNVEFLKEGEVTDQKIAPLLLITFLENAFKHGAKGSSGNTFIRVDINIEKEKLNFEIENNKGSIDEIEKGEHNGLGLENIKRQLQLLYPGKHQLNIKDQQDRFMVALQLSL